MAKAALIEPTETPTSLERATAGPERLLLFLKDVRAEMRKVVTPSRAEVQATTTVVLATVFIFAMYFWLVDIILGRGVDKIFTWATRH